MLSTPPYSSFSLRDRPLLQCRLNELHLAFKADEGVALQAKSLAARLIVKHHQQVRTASAAPLVAITDQHAVAAGLDLSCFVTGLPPIQHESSR